MTVFLRLATTLAIPGWATSATGLLLIVLLQAMMLSFVFCFVILGDRNGTTFLPLRDYLYFTAGTRTLYERPAVAIGRPTNAGIGHQPGLPAQGARGARPAKRRAAAEPVEVVDEQAVTDHGVGFERLQRRVGTRRTVGPCFVDRADDQETRGGRRIVVAEA